MQYLLAILVIASACFGGAQSLQRYDTDLILFNKYKPNWKRMLESPPDMWLTFMDSNLRATICELFPAFSCDPDPWTTGPNINCENPNPAMIFWQPSDFYHSNRFLCGKKQKSLTIRQEKIKDGPFLSIDELSRALSPVAVGGWRMDEMYSKLANVGVPGYSDGCLKDECYSYCLEKGKEPECDPGYSLVGTKDKCINGHEYYFITFTPVKDGYTKEFITTEMYEAQCCGQDGYCKELYEYSEARPYLECLDEDYTGTCTTETDSLIWIALMYCGDADRRFLCCCSSECYWTNCQSESKIKTREIRHIEDNYDCSNGNSNLCSFYSKFESYYDAAVFCADKEVKTGYFEKDYFCNPYCAVRKFLPSCELLGNSEPYLIYPGDSNPNNFPSKAPPPSNGLGLTAAGLAALTPQVDTQELLEQRKWEKEIDFYSKYRFRKSSQYHNYVFNMGTGLVPNGKKSLQPQPPPQSLLSVPLELRPGFWK